MKSLKTISLVSGFIGLTGALLAAPAMSAPGKGWDVLNVGQGDYIHASSPDMVTSQGASAGKGYDVFRSGDGERITDVAKGYMGTSLGGSSGQGWDAFNVGDGDKI